MPTNRERLKAVAEKIGAGPDWAERYAAEAERLGLIAPDPEPRYKRKPYPCAPGRTFGTESVNEAVCGDGLIVLYFQHHNASEAQRAAVLDALNALAEKERDDG